MEYSDFLDHWEGIERTQLFDVSWVQSSQWLDVKTRPLPSACQFGDVSCSSILLPYHIVVSTHAHFLIKSQFHRFKKHRLYTRIITIRYALLPGCGKCCKMVFRLSVFKRGEDNVLGSSSYSYGLTRSVTLSMELQPGDYVVQVTLAIRNSYFHSQTVSFLGPVK